ncbi:MAG: TetR-like C-terminal domain-containing protein [Eubacteriales bacterium]|nr:TetR-like C-terminal domain-containing protein [Eubacteriales bacterium]MDD4541248.1 TetR-like C-terminal domain-containing protein [Eubacteriales bacterium]
MANKAQKNQDASDFVISFVASPEKGDRRSRRTDMLLQESLVQLLQKKNLRDITVSELTENADLSRTTFYLHYDNIDQLYNQLEANLYQQFVKILSANTDNSHPVQHVAYAEDGTSTIPIIASVCRTIEGNPLLAATIVNNPNSQLLQRIYSAGYDSLIENLLSQYPDLPKYKIDYYYSFLVNGIVGMIETWLLRNQEEDVEEFIELLTDYTLTHLQHLEKQLKQEDQ